MPDAARWKSPSFDRLWRLVALFILCALVYYFSFDNGRLAARKYKDAEVARLSAENESLRVQLALQSQEIERLKGHPRGEASPGPEGRANPTAPDSPDAGGLAPRAESSGDLEERGAVAPQAGGEGVAPLNVARLALREEENRLILGNQVLLTILDVDNIDKIVTLRAHHLDTEKRETHTLGLGESFIIERGEGRHRLLLDQMKSSQVVLLLIDP
ncbi:MAG: hypothetical protein LBO66_07205 [Deltaproteobacteria bacterium]|jgi:hypothetical protein|nr:hypothetical protein [Deltaproteobacteria bacterium]